MRMLFHAAALLALCAGVTAAQTEDVAAKSHRGKELIAAGRFEEAIPIYRDLAKDLPGEPGVFMNLGLALHMSGNQPEAIEQFERVLKLNPRHTTAQLFLGIAYLELKKPAEAIPPLKAVIQAEPKNKDARLALGQAYLLTERYQPGSEQFERLASLDPGNPKTWNGLGLSYEGLANRAFAELERKAIGSPYWVLLVADSRASVGAYTRAFLLYREGEAALPSMHGIHTAIAEIYRQTGKPEWAEAEKRKEQNLPPLICKTATAVPLSRRLECAFAAGQHKRVIQLAGVATSPAAYFWRVRAYNELARAAFLRLSELPASAEVHELLAGIAFNRRKYEESAKEWDEALKLAPGNPYYRLRLAIALGIGNQYERARDILQDLLKSTPDSSQADFWMGYTLLGLLQTDEAIPYLEKAVAADPSGPLGHKELGRAYLQAGRLEDAVPQLESALQADDDGSVHYQLSQAYRRMGRTELAKQMLDKFQEIENPSKARRGQPAQTAEITPP